MLAVVSKLSDPVRSGKINGKGGLLRRYILRKKYFSDLLLYYSI